MPALPEKLAAARSRLAVVTPYYAAGLFALRFVKSERIPTGTMGASRDWTVLYDPRFVARKSVEDLAFTLLHELGHLLREHHPRQQGRSALAMTPDGRPIAVWNLAGDKEINDDLKNLPFEPAIRAETFNPPELPDGELAETYYEMLLARAANAPCNCGGGSATGGEPLPDEGSSGGEHLDEAARQAIRRRVAQDVRDAAKQRGDVPGGLQRWADGVLDVTLPAHVLLSSAVRATYSALVRGRSDYCFARPSRRVTRDGLVFPALVQYLPRVAVLIDTSGSMSSEELGRALGVVKRATASVGRVEVFSCDAAVHGRQRVFSASAVALLGGGGTSMAEGVRSVVAEATPDILIVVTDGFTDWPTAESVARTTLFWAITNAEQTPPEGVPGEVVRV